MEVRRALFTLILCGCVLDLTSCLARRRLITRNGKSTTVQTLLTADKQSLLKRIDDEYRSIGSLNATVDMVPAIGSVNKGKITEYKDVRAYILFRKPADIRLIGLYPVVRNKAFDMVSNGARFRLYVPSQNRFIEGSGEVVTPSPNKLENLRPSVFLEALLVQPVDPHDELSVLEDFTDEDNAAYIVQILHKNAGGQLDLARNVWFDRLTLHMVRQKIFDPSGQILTDVRYSDWDTFQRVPFPKKIDINRPKDEYGVVITVVRMNMNQPITDDKFVLEQPEGTVLHVLGAKPGSPPAPPKPTS